jgi:hypothetical protein
LVFLSELPYRRATLGSRQGQMGCTRYQMDNSIEENRFTFFNASLLCSFFYNKKPLPG